MTLPMYIMDTSVVIMTNLKDSDNLVFKELKMMPFSRNC